jgi:uncharacterized protein (DUF1778 family)
MARKTRAEAPSTPVPVRLSPAERQQVVTAASLNRQTISQFARDALVTAASDCLEIATPVTRRAGGSRAPRLFLPMREP